MHTQGWMYWLMLCWNAIQNVLPTPHPQTPPAPSGQAKQKQVKRSFSPGSINIGMTK